MPSSKKKNDVVLDFQPAYAIWITLDFVFDRQRIWTAWTANHVQQTNKSETFDVKWAVFPMTKRQKTMLNWFGHYTIELHNLCFLVQCMQYCSTFFSLIHNSSGLSCSTERHGRQSRQECLCGAGFGGDLDDLFLRTRQQSATFSPSVRLVILVQGPCLERSLKWSMPAMHLLKTLLDLCVSSKFEPPHSPIATQQHLDGSYLQKWIQSSLGLGHRLRKATCPHSQGHPSPGPARSRRSHHWCSPRSCFLVGLSSWPSGAL